MTAPLPSLYVQTIAVVRGILPVVLACAGFIALTGLVPEAPVLRILALIAATLAVAVTAYAACLFVLSDGAVAENRAFGLLLSGFGTNFIMAWLFPPLVLLLIELVAQHVLGAGDAAITYLSIFDGFALLFLFARYGTLYPALLDGADPSLAAAGERVPTGAVFWRLLGATLFGIATLMAILVFFFILDSLSPPGTRFVLAVIMRLVTFVCILGIVTAMAVVLCNAYRGAYGIRTA